MTTKNEVREEIKTRLMRACPNVDITYALNAMESLFDSVLAKKREEIDNLETHWEAGDERHEWARRAYRKAQDDIIKILTN